MVRLADLRPKERAPGNHWIGGWVGHRAVLDAVVKKKIPRPRRESNPTTPIVQPMGVSKSFRTSRPEQELQIIQLSATTCSCIAIL